MRELSSIPHLFPAREEHHAFRFRFMYEAVAWRGNHRLQRKLDMLGEVPFLLLEGEYLQCKRRCSSFIRALPVTEV